MMFLNMDFRMTTLIYSLVFLCMYKYFCLTFLQNYANVILQVQSYFESYHGCFLVFSIDYYYLFILRQEWTKSQFFAKKPNILFCHWTHQAYMYS